MTAKKTTERSGKPLLGNGVHITMRMSTSVYDRACRKAAAAGITFLDYLRQLVAHDLGLLGSHAEEEEVVPPLGPVPRIAGGGK